MDERDLATQPAESEYPHDPRTLRPSLVALVFALLGLVAFGAANALEAPQTIMRFSEGTDLKRLDLNGLRLLGVLLFVAWVPLCVVFSAGLVVWAIAGSRSAPLGIGDRIALLFVLGTVVVLGIHFGKQSKDWYATYQARVAANSPADQ